MKYSKPTSKKADLFDRNQANKKVGTIDVYTEQGVSTIIIEINGQKPLQQMMAEKAVKSKIESLRKALFQKNQK